MIIATLFSVVFIPIGLSMVAVFLVFLFLKRNKTKVGVE